MRSVIVILLVVFLFGCDGSNRPAKPDNLIPKDRMSDILYDVFLLNAAKGINKRILENNGVNPQEFVYKKYHIDSLQFALSNEYYSYDTKTYEGIIEKVKQKIEEEKKKNDALNIKEEKSKDSLKDAVRKNSKPDSIPLLKPSLKSKAFGKDKG